MTINKLHQLTTKLLANGHGRKLVCIDKSKFNHPLEPDGCCIIPVSSAELDTHEMLDEHGGHAELANGQAKQRTALVLIGD